MKRFIAIIIILIMTFSMVAVTYADCTPDATSGNDTIICTGNSPGTTLSGSGNDLIINYGTAGFLEDEAGNSTIINYGTADGLIGNEGNDTVINYGTVTTIYGDSGNDTIINYGAVDNILARDDDDRVIIRGGTVTLLIDGGDGYDTLEFELSICHHDPRVTELSETFQTIPTLNPSGDTVVLNGSYTWTQFEELVATELWITFCDGRNETSDAATPLVTYCNSLGGFDIYDVNAIGVDGRTTEGVLAIQTTYTEVRSALDLAISTGQNQLIESDTQGNQFWALNSNELQIMGPEVNEIDKIYTRILSPSECGVS